MHLVDPPEKVPAREISFEAFRAVDIGIGTVRAAAPPEGARKPSIRLVIDFGPGISEKKSSAQITAHYEPDALIGRQVAAVVNFPSRQIGKFMSELLILGFADRAGEILLFSPDQPVPNGARFA